MPSILGYTVLLIYCHFACYFQLVVPHFDIFYRTGNKPGTIILQQFYVLHTDLLVVLLYFIVALRLRVSKVKQKFAYVIFLCYALKMYTYYISEPIDYLFTGETIIKKGYFLPYSLTALNI